MLSAVGLRDILLCVERLARETNSSGINRDPAATSARTEWEDFKRYAEVFAPDSTNGAVEKITKAFGSLEGTSCVYWLLKTISSLH